MAREYGRIRISIADDDDFESLSADAQWFYTRILIPEPSLNYAGVADWRPARLLRKSSDMTMHRLMTAAVEVEQRSYALFDVETEEVLLRTLIRSDELLKNPKMAAAVLAGYSKTSSRTLRAAVVSEIQTARKEHPEYSSWSHKDTSDPLSKLLSRTNLQTVGYTVQLSVQNTDTNPVKNTNPDPVQNTDQNLYPDRSEIPIAIGLDPLSTSNIQLATSTKGGYVKQQTHLSDDPDQPPSPNCSTHPNGTERPCRACGVARAAREAWDTQRAESTKSARRAAIEDCEWCDSLGWRIEPVELRDYAFPAIRCDHDRPMHIDEWRAMVPELAEGGTDA